jgi:phenylacetate-CoA ligase
MTTLQHLSYGLRHALRDNVWSRRRTHALLEHDRWSLARLHELRDALLYRTLHAAQRTIARYRHITPPASPAEALASLRRDYPVVSKTELLARRDLYYPHGGRSRPWTIKGKTSGTTGTPLELFRSLDSVRWEQAFKKRHWAWCGFHDGMRRASLRGDAIVPVDRTEPPFWLFNRFGNQLLLSSRHLQRPYLGEIVETLRNFRPHLLEAYPSTAFGLATYLEQQHSELRIPFVYTGSEILYAYQRELIEARIGRVMDFYGMAERVAFAAECEAGNLHLNSDYSFVEIVDDSGRETAGPGYVVGTTFHNLAMPLVRYRLSDRAAWKPGSCPCGRLYPLMEAVSGKFEDVIFGGTGEPVSPSLVTFAFKGVHNIECSQVAQVSPEIWEVRIVPATGYSEADAQQVVRNIGSMVDARITVRTRTVSEIPRTAAGKYRWIVNETGSGKSEAS